MLLIVSEDVCDAGDLQPANRWRSSWCSRTTFGARGPLQQIRGSIVSAHRPSLVIVGNMPDLSQRELMLRD